MEHLKRDSMWERACSGRRSDEGDLKANIFVGCDDLFASRLAPTGNAFIDPNTFLSALMDSKRWT
jgi:hypothetical protein